MAGKRGAPGAATLNLFVPLELLRWAWFPGEDACPDPTCI